MARTAALPILTAEPGLTHYFEEIRRFPMLKRQEEYMLAKRWCEHGDRDAAHKLVTSHLRLVTKIARDYRGYGLPMSMPVRSAAPIALRYSVSIRAWAHTKLIRQIVLTVTWTKLKSSNAASLVMLPAGAFEPEIIPPMDEVLRRYRRPLTEHRPEHKLNRDSAVPRLIHCRGSF
jgi:hypothetical protein